MERLSCAFSWPQVAVQVLMQLLGTEALCGSLLCQASRCTSCFSGIGTAEWAWELVGVALVAAGLPFQLKPQWACERDPLCQGVILDRLVGSHLFTDVADLFARPAGCFSLQGMFSHFMVTPLSRTAYCMRHCCQCPVWPGPRG